MSRIGKRLIEVPKGVTVTITGQHVAVKGTKGNLERTLPAEVALEQEGSTIKVVRRDESKAARQRHGLSRTLIANMVEGVSNGFERKLQILAHRVARVERVVLKHQCHVAFCRGPVVYIFASNFYGATIETLKPGYQAKRRRFACTSWAKQHKELAIGDIQRQAVDGSVQPKMLGSIVKPDLRH